MKKTFKYFGIISGCLLTPLIINRIYFTYMGKKSKPYSNYNIYFWRFGRIPYKVRGHGKPLLLVHGIYPGADMTQWNNIDPVLYKSYRVYTLDLLGFGQSEKPKISYSAYMYTRLICDFIRDVIKAPALVAASDYSAAYAIMGYIFEPSLYNKIIAISPAGIKRGYCLPTFKDLIKKWLLETPILGDLAYILITNTRTANFIFKKLQNKLSILYYPPRIVSASAFIGGPIAKFPIAALFSKYLNVKITHQLNRIKIPMLILTRENIGLYKLSKRVKNFLEI